MKKRKGRDTQDRMCNKGATRSVIEKSAHFLGLPLAGVSSEEAALLSGISSRAAAIPAAKSLGRLCGRGVVFFIVGNEVILCERAQCYERAHRRKGALGRVLQPKESG